jgi:hypothetical protein
MLSAWQAKLSYTPGARIIIEIDVIVIILGSLRSSPIDQHVNNSQSEATGTARPRRVDHNSTAQGRLRQSQGDCQLAKYWARWCSPYTPVSEGGFHGVPVGLFIVLVAPVQGRGSRVGFLVRLVLLDRRHGPW